MTTDFEANKIHYYGQGLDFGMKMEVCKVRNKQKSNLQLQSCHVRGVRANNDTLSRRQAAVQPGNVQ